MPTVLHIDGLSEKRMEYHETTLGETLKESLDRMGASYRLERIPDGPKTGRRLSREAAEFIRSYVYEETSSVLAIFWRYHSLEAEEFDTADEAERFLETGEDYGSLAGEAIVDGDQITVLD